MIQHLSEAALRGHVGALRAFNTISDRLVHDAAKSEHDTSAQTSMSEYLGLQLDAG
jgi:hypothetical protein